MKKYVTYILLSAKQTLTYRLNYFFTILTSFITVFSQYFIWRALFSETSIINGMAWEQMKTYLFIAFFINSFISWSSESAISRRIKDGSIAMDLIKPVSFQGLQYAITFGSSIVESGISIFLIAVIGPVFGFFSLTINTGVIFFGLVSIVLSFSIKFCIVYLCGLLSFWTTSSTGISWARIAITNFFSGALMPLTMFPGWLRQIAEFLPFKNIIHIPLQIVLGESNALLDNFLLIGSQAAWLAGLLMFAFWFSGIAIRKVTINGG